MSFEEGLEMLYNVYRDRDKLTKFTMRRKVVEKQVGVDLVKNFPQSIEG
jgi:hypothetical protein